MKKELIKSAYDITILEGENKVILSLLATELELLFEEFINNQGFRIMPSDKEFREEEVSKILDVCELLDVHPFQKDITVKIDFDMDEYAGEIVPLVFLEYMIFYELRTLEFYGTNERWMRKHDNLYQLSYTSDYETIDTVLDTVDGLREDEEDLTDFISILKYIYKTKEITLMDVYIDCIGEERIIIDLEISEDLYNQFIS